MLDLSPEVFRKNFNRRHFILQHELTGHPLFELPRLIELARDTAPGGRMTCTTMRESPT